MIILDTSIWVEHFRRGDPRLANLIENDEIVLHPYVHGELLLGGIAANRSASAELQIMPVAPVASANEAAAFIAWAKLAGTGVGYVDAHILMSARLLPNGKVMTLDKDLRAQAEKLDLVVDLQ